MHDTHQYDDIIHLARPASARPPMPMLDRAAQFSPFAALTTYAAAIEEEGRLTDRMVELDESTKAILGAKLQILDDCAAEEPEVTITYFRPDARKAGGAYTRAAGRLKRIDTVEQTVMLTDGTRIPIEHICAVDAPCLAGMGYD